MLRNHIWGGGGGQSNDDLSYTVVGRGGGIKLSTPEAFDIINECTLF